MGKKPYGYDQRRVVKFQATSAQEVINDAKLINFNDEESWKAFEDNHRARLERDPKSNVHSSGRAEDEVFHLVAKDVRGFPDYAEFTKWAIKRHRQLLECRDGAGFPPLHLALVNQNHGFVALVLERADEVWMLIEQYTGVALTGLHRAIWHRSPFTEAILDKIRDAPDTKSRNQQFQVNSIRSTPGLDRNSHELADIFTRVSTEAIYDTERGYPGMTALHFAATLARPSSDDDEDYNQCLTALSTQPKPADNRMGPPSHSGKVEAGFDGTRTPISPVIMHNLLRRGTMGEGSPIDDMDKMAKLRGHKLGCFDDASDSIRTKPPRETEEKRLDAFPARDLLVKMRNQPRRFDPLAIVRKLVEAKPDVLVNCRDALGNTPFQARLSFLQSELEDQGRDEKVDRDGQESKGRKECKERHEIINEDAVLRFMREYIISNYDRREAMKALYPIGEGKCRWKRVLEFDLSGLPHSTIDSEFLNGLGKVLRFEGLLKYVALPRLTVEVDDNFDLGEGSVLLSGKSKEPEQVDKTKGKGLNHMNSIFRWLKANHVGSILKVTVIDDLEPSHSDEAIETCIDDLNVRVWNWYKVDLSCQVILNSARNVRDVTLYSSGNNAVLMGWSSSSGLALLPEGLEKPKRLEAYMDTFRAELKRHRPHVEFTWQLHKPSQNYDSVFTKRGAEKTTESRWMKSMKEFGVFLKEARPKHAIEPIKIAVIDDGINTALDIFSGRIQVGESFSPLSEVSGRWGAYYVPSGPHGTLMAQLICEVCPVVKLYIAQLEVLPGQDGRRSFTPESATEAINWAVTQKVDIISMSWSINSNNDSYRDLDKALLGAVNGGIVMFCSSIDEGPTAPDNTYPGKEQNCIKIGAATGNGARLSWVSETKSDYLLPGESIQHSSQTKLWGNTQSGLFGSSVATAIASGLAGVLIYCDRLLHVAQRGAYTSASPNGAQEPLKSSSSMRNAFKNLAKATESNKFVQIWEHLPLDENELLVWDDEYDPDGTDATKQKLKEFMNMVKK
ncbi:hypothetical protein DL768_010602 [Monosporascus sp. mg162]|nr:hypothetical protein DL768_010602 [Monosporascus sp. mg162]